MFYFHKNHPFVAVTATQTWYMEYEIMRCESAGEVSLSKKFYFIPNFLRDFILFL